MPPEQWKIFAAALVWIIALDLNFSRFIGQNIAKKNVETQKFKNCKKKECLKKVQNYANLNPKTQRFSN